jgi:putative chitinase
MRPDVAAKIMVRGMEQGAFTHKKLSDYLPLSGRAGFDAYKNARRIINGTDKADEIAKLAQKFEAALIAGGWK